MIKLYRHPLSGNSHRAELFLSLLGLDYHLIDVDLAAAEHKQPAFLKKNPFGQLPVLEDNGAVISESTAILVYLAAKSAPEKWLPSDPVKAADIERWLSISTSRIQQGPAHARLVTVFNAPFNHQEKIDQTHAFLSVLEDTLKQSQWLVGNEFSLAEIAAYTYIAHAPEGGVSLEQYPAIRDWLTRIESMSGFIGMQKSPNTVAA